MAEKSKRKGETSLDRKLKRLKREVPDSDLVTNKEDASSSAADDHSTTTNNETSALTQKRYINKQRVLILGSRGLTSRYRHLMNDLRKLLPHSKKENKVEHHENLQVINELCEMKSCNNVIFLETRKKTDLFLWIGKTPNGPMAKFHCHNVHTMDELRLTGNCMAGSRPLLSFDPAFESEAHLRLLKEMLTQVFGTPNHHPKSKPFVDHVFGFYLLDGRIWFRNYQIIESEDKKAEPMLVEVGPRIVLHLVKIFAGSFSGETLYSNTNYVTPNAVRRIQKAHKSGRYLHRKQAEEELKAKKSELVIEPNELDEVFRDAVSNEDADGEDGEVELAPKKKQSKAPAKKNKKEQEEDEEDDD